MMYRSRLGTDLNNITLDYVSSINDDSEIAMYDIVGSQAHTIMLFQNNIITKNDAKITLVGIKDQPGVAASIFKPLSINSINVDDDKI